MRQLLLLRKLNKVISMNNENQYNTKWRKNKNVYITIQQSNFLKFWQVIIVATVTLYLKDELFL